MAKGVPRKRLLVFIVAYNAEKTIQNVLRRVPSSLLGRCDVEVLVIDDSSVDGTFERSAAIRKEDTFPFRLHTLFNPVNQGYGGNQKIGFHYAIEQGFDFVALVHGDGQYAPECLPEFVEPLAKGEADAVFGSRMLMRGEAIKGGMPLYKYMGNKILTGLQNWMLGTNLSEFHSGYRVYTTDALRKVPFDLNTNVFHFDTEIIIQLLIAGQRIQEVPIPTYYGDEICYVNGWKYAWDVTVATVEARIQELGIFYHRKYDCASTGPSNAHYRPKLGYRSPHTLTLSEVDPGARVLDLGCAGGYLGAELRKKGCHVTGVDACPLADGVELDTFIRWDLNAGPPPVDLRPFDVILMLDVIEHLLRPEEFVAALREGGLRPETKLVVSTGNVGFVLTRFGLVFGNFNYGKRGILDITHTRLFTFATVKRLFRQANYEILSVKGTPVPFILAIGDNMVARTLLAINNALVFLRPSVFAFQSFMVLRARPSLAHLLHGACVESERRLEAAGRSRA